MLSLRDLQSKPGDFIDVFWKRLIQWAKQKDVIIRGAGAGDVRVNEGPEGTEVIVPSRNGWPHWWRAALAGAGSVRIEPGSVDGNLARIGGVRLDGRLAADPTQPAPNGGQPPYLPLGDVRPRPEDPLRTFISVDMHLENEEAAQLGPELVHVNLDREDDGRQPIAILDWEPDAAVPYRLRQVVMHNLGYARQVPAEGEGVPRDFFFAI